jgi:hypothetical protein
VFYARGITMTLTKVLYGLLLLKIYSLSAQPIVPTIEEKNKEADTAFLQWKKRTPHPEFSKHLRDLLTEEGIKYIVDASQMPFSKVLTDGELKKKVTEVAQEFIKKFEKQGAQKSDLGELSVLVTEVIQPESVFQVPIDTLDAILESAYDTLITHLKSHKTPVGTTLQEWALKFLTSESMIVALPFIDKAEIEGKSFNDLSSDQKEGILRQTAHIVAQRFMNNLRPVQQKFKFTVPARTEEAIEAKTLQFLRHKFSSTEAPQFVRIVKTQKQAQ